MLRGVVLYCSVVKIVDAAGLAPIDHDGTQADESGFTNLVVRIEHQPVKSVVEAAKTILSKPSGSITDLGIGGLVLLSDLRPRVDECSGTYPDAGCSGRATDNSKNPNALRQFDTVGGCSRQPAQPETRSQRSQSVAKSFLHRMVMR